MFELNEYKGDINKLSDFLDEIGIDITNVAIIKDFTNSPILDKYRDDLSFNRYYLLRIKDYDITNMNQVYLEETGEVFALQTYEDEEEETPEIFEYLNKK